MLQEKFAEVLVAEVTAAPAMEHDLLVCVPRFYKGAVEVAEEAPGGPAHDGDDGGGHGGDPGVDGTGGEDEFGGGIGGEEFGDHAGGWKVHDGLEFSKYKRFLQSLVHDVGGNEMGGVKLENEGVKRLGMEGFLGCR